MNERTRQGRTAEVAQERRRRDGANLGARTKLAIPEDVKARLEAEGREVRWANDVSGRIHQLTVLDDWDKVDGVEPVPVVIDRKNGVTVQAHLLSKPKAHVEEDRRVADKARKDAEGAMLKGRVPTGPGAEPAPVRGQMGAGTYVTDSTAIGRGNQIIE